MSTTCFWSGALERHRVGATHSVQHCDGASPRMMAIFAFNQKQSMSSCRHSVSRAIWYDSISTSWNTCIIKYRQWEHGTSNIKDLEVGNFLWWQGSHVLCTVEVLNASETSLHPNRMQTLYIYHNTWQDSTSQTWTYAKDIFEGVGTDVHAATLLQAKTAICLLFTFLFRWLLQSHHNCQWRNGSNSSNSSNGCGMCLIMLW